MPSYDDTPILVSPILSHDFVSQICALWHGQMKFFATSLVYCAIKFSSWGSNLFSTWKRNRHGASADVESFYSCLIAIVQYDRTTTILYFSYHPKQARISPAFITHWESHISTAENSLSWLVIQWCINLSWQPLSSF